MFNGRKNKQMPCRFDTLIANGTQIKGDIELVGGLHIDGNIDGNIKAADDNRDAVIRLSEEGEVNGNIEAPHIVINGKVFGDIYCSEHIELAAKASITGNVYYHLIEMAVGAEVNGSLVHQKEDSDEQRSPVVRSIALATEEHK